MQYRTGAAPLNTLTEQIQVSVVASNEANEPPAWVGVIPLWPTVLDGVTQTLDTSLAPDAEIVLVQGVLAPATATPCYIGVYDFLVGVDPWPPNGPPQFCFPLGDGAGGPFGNTWPMAYRSRLSGNRYFRFATLDDIATGSFAGAGEAYIQALVR